MKKPWKRLTICLSEDHFKRLRILAANHDISMSEAVRTLLKAYSVAWTVKQDELKTAKPS